MLSAFMLMLACTPSSLYRDNKRRATKVVQTVLTPDTVPADETRREAAPVVAEVERIPEPEPELSQNEEPEITPEP